VGVPPAFPIQSTAKLALNPHLPSARTVKAARMAARRFTVSGRDAWIVEVLRVRLRAWWPESQSTDHAGMDWAVFERAKMPVEKRIGSV